MELFEVIRRGYAAGEAIQAALSARAALTESSSNRLFCVFYPYNQQLEL